MLYWAVRPTNCASRESRRPLLHQSIFTIARVPDAERLHAGAEPAVPHVCACRLRCRCCTTCDEPSYSDPAIIAPTHAPSTTGPSLLCSAPPATARRGLPCYARPTAPVLSRRSSWSSTHVRHAAGPSALHMDPVPAPLCTTAACRSSCGHAQAPTTTLSGSTSLWIRSRPAECLPTGSVVNGT